MQVISTAIIIFFCCTIFLIYSRPLAIKFSFVDIPNTRKSHNGHIPLLGGLSTLIGIWVINVMMPNLLPFQSHYILLTSFLALVGLIDDKFDISAISRLIVLSLIAVWLAQSDGIILSYLGNFWGLGEVTLGAWSTLFSVCAVIGCITAFNMIDGIDGLLGSLASISIGSLGVMFWQAGYQSISLFCFLFIVSMLAYVCFNLGINVKSKHKVFMGDSGSFLVGFTVLWLLVFATQKVEGVTNLGSAMKPVTALWIIAVPLMDMLLVISRRLVNKKSPLLADRTHIHHIVLRAGYTSKQALVGVSLLALLLAAIGILIEVSGVPAVYSFGLFLMAFFLYAVSRLNLQASETPCSERSL
ncbi:UDP-N-acetylglucosamine--undecaprenyl-phosphate N-acetylglucosaminephosphotransferase [Vibrio crassostreae]|uniref:UDP-N-acetylglucosamine--undecaprenyl-phosphate N-acetylglucosaminephosphotransferase n=1 Tax=Vibrio crassostreae TaxID=246167 RepID=UPI001B307914|nr:UDP-N-acetylglucosamine--undecaprenyl-phosphate N-acetylglucosaminephosphotransferase [Vibrio crassostreae]